jgi:hypothetical protein
VSARARSSLRRPIAAATAEHHCARSKADSAAQAGQAARAAATGGVDVAPVGHGHGGEGSPEEGLTAGIVPPPPWRQAPPM